MAGQSRSEVVGLILLAAVMATLFTQVGALLSAPASTTTDFHFQENEQRDGNASLGPTVQDSPVVLRLGFVGDIMQHRRQASDDFDACYRELRPLLAQCDLTVGNLEFPVDVTRPVGPPVGSVRFNGSPEHIGALAEAGFDILSTANNHCFDQGMTGLARTRQVVAQNGLAVVGNLDGSDNDHPVIVERNGVRVAFFAYTFRPNSYPDVRGRVQYWQVAWPVHELNFFDWSDEYRAEGLKLTALHVHAARKAKVDLLVALVHWGREWQFQPTADQRLAGHDLIDQGFDLVVGSHGHVLNPIEVYRGRLVAYSLGNLISDFRALEARTGALLQVDFGRSALGSMSIVGFRAIPVVTEQPRHHVRPVHAEGAAHLAVRHLAQKVLGPACIYASALGLAAGGPTDERRASGR